MGAIPLIYPATSTRLEAKGSFLVRGRSISIADETEDGSPATNDWVLVESNAGGTWRKVQVGNIGGGGDALVANPLSQFAATTSLQLKNTISDETGSGALVFATSPTLVTPLLGTPTSGVLTNCTGLPMAAIVGAGTVNQILYSDGTKPTSSSALTWDGSIMTITTAGFASARYVGTGLYNGFYVRATNGAGQPYIALEHLTTQQAYFIYRQATGTASIGIDNSTDIINIGSTGLVGIGVAPVARLDLLAPASVTGLKIQANATPGTYLDFLDSGSANVLKCDSTGKFSIGNGTASSAFHVDSNAANTTAIATFENTAGDFQIFRSDATPEGAITGSIGDLCIDGTNGRVYTKRTGAASNTGWLSAAHSEYASLTTESNAVETTFAGTSADFSQMSQVTIFTANGIAAGLTPDHTNDHITVANAGDYEMTINFSFSGGLLDTYSFAFFKNNGATQLGGTRLTRKLGTGGDVGSASLTVQATLAAADTIEVWMQNEDDTSAALIEDAEFSMRRLN